MLTGLFVVFGGYTAWVAAASEVRLIPYLGALASNSWSAQILVDLTIALGLVCAWLIGDARRRGRRAWPWLVATPVFGSLAPLLYLVMRSWASAREAS